MAKSEALVVESAVVDPDEFARSGYPHERWRRLREAGPLLRVEEGPGAPYWAVFRHAEIVAVSKRPQDFLNGPRLEVVGAVEAPSIGTLISMDPPKHGSYRQLTSRAFSPRAIAALRPRVDAIVGELLDGLAGEENFDFVSRVAAPLPIAVIGEMLGVPRDDWGQLFTWTNQSVAATDPEFRQEGESPQETQARAHRELFSYFAKLREERLQEPQDDLLTRVAQARVEDGQIDPMEALAYYLILVAAGNETTRNAISGGLLAMIEHPEAWQRLRGEPALLDSAVEEILRWTCPVACFARTASRDVELAGQAIPKGDVLALLYASANRDERVFPEPFDFRIDRRPNRHLAFGVGEHFCLGAHLARLELSALFRQLASRVREAELSGPLERVRAGTLGAIKRMPVRVQLEAV